MFSSSPPSHLHPHQLPNTPDSNDINMICNIFFWCWDRNFRQVSGQSGSPYLRKRLGYLPYWWLSWWSLVGERHGNLDQWETTWWNIILTDPKDAENCIVKKGTQKTLKYTWTFDLSLWISHLVRKGHIGNLKRSRKPTVFKFSKNKISKSFNQVRIIQLKWPNI